MQERITAGLPPVATNTDCTIAVITTLAMRNAKAYGLAASMLRIVAILHREASHNPADRPALAKYRAEAIAAMTIGGKKFAEISADWPEELRQLF